MPYADNKGADQPAHLDGVRNDAIGTGLIQDRTLSIIYQLKTGVMSSYKCFKTQKLPLVSMNFLCNGPVILCLRPVCNQRPIALDKRRQSLIIARLVLEIVNSHTNKLGCGEGYEDLRA